MKLSKHQPAVRVCGLLTILVPGAFAAAAPALATQRVSVGVSPATGGGRTLFTGTFIVPSVRAGHIVEAALTPLTINQSKPCTSGSYVPFHTPAAQRAHVTFGPGARPSIWCPGTYHVQVSSYNSARFTSIVLGTSRIVHVS